MRRRDDGRPRDARRCVDRRAACPRRRRARVARSPGLYGTFIADRGPRRDHRAGARRSSRSCATGAAPATTSCRRRSTATSSSRRSGPASRWSTIVVPARPHRPRARRRSMPRSGRTPAPRSGSRPSAGAGGSSYPNDGVVVEGLGTAGPEVYVPVGENVHVTLTGEDVIHAFYVPQFLFKKDAVPGRENAFAFTVDEPGRYGGQCAEFCGIYHSRCRSPSSRCRAPEYDAWVATHRGIGEPRPMTTLTDTRPGGDAPAIDHATGRGFDLLGWLATTDHKRIGVMYGVAALGFFLAAGVMALVIRAELAVPGPPAGERAGLQRPVHHPRHRDDAAVRDADGRRVRELPHPAPGRARRTWSSRASTRSRSGCSCSAGSSCCRGSSSRPGRPTSAGRATRPNSTLPYSTTTGTDLWIVGLLLTGVASILGAVNFVATIFTRRAPGMAHVPDARVHLVDARDVRPDPVRVPGDHRGAGHAAAGAPVRGRVLQPVGGRRPDPVAAPVLVLRPPGGLHHRAAVLRRDGRDVPGVQPQAAVRLPGVRAGDDLHRRLLDDGLGAPHVHDRAPSTCRSSRRPRSSSRSPPGSSSSTGSSR